ncbi:MAG TPA: 1,4-dihydroxy-6-naphthoate synthase [Saprospiraceae bacterium]|nr:1,4-dihydroxy-6-naphthoate synthase [Saprospiraceae bacterium]
MKLTLGFSPCPNDTFIFDAIVNKKIDLHGLDFEVCMEDVETLNEWALEGKLDITKLSYHAYAYCHDEYVILNSGSALGNNCGPLFISKKLIDEKDLSNISVAIPGKLTTAHFLFSIFYPHIKNKQQMLFSEIENAILDERVDAGVIIHENRFTYEEKGLKKICDLGEKWEKETHYPIPLGGIMLKRDKSDDLGLKLDKIIHDSIQHAYLQKPLITPFIKAHSQELSDEVIYKHIALYVNKYSLNLGIKGREAIQYMYQKATELELIKPLTHNIFSHN